MELWSKPEVLYPDLSLEMAICSQANPTVKEKVRLSLQRFGPLQTDPSIYTSGSPNYQESYRLGGQEGGARDRQNRDVARGGGVSAPPTVQFSSLRLVDRGRPLGLATPLNGGTSGSNEHQSPCTPGDPALDQF
ncbi:unnamed protein product [Gadus morhua 'NCC']